MKRPNPYPTLHESYPPPYEHAVIAAPPITISNDIQKLQQHVDPVLMYPPNTKSEMNHCYSPSSPPMTYNETPAEPPKPEPNPTTNINVHHEFGFPEPSPCFKRMRIFIIFLFILGLIAIICLSYWSYGQFTEFKKKHGFDD